MALRFNPAPGWPVPPEGWFPTADWAPDPSWPSAPAGWRIVELVGAPDARPVAQYGAPAVVPAPKRSSIVRSGGVTYDAALLPVEFHARGFRDADFDHWESLFYEGLSRADQPLCQALAQGEIDRCGEGAHALSTRLAAMGRQEAVRWMPRLRGEGDELQRYLQRVSAVVARHQSR